MSVRAVIDDLRTAVTMPRVQIVVSRGSPHEEVVLRRFRERHPRYKVVRSKAVGAALLPLGDFADVDGYLATRRTARKRVRRASRLGYSGAVFEPEQRRDELLAIHSSIPERQGRPIDAEYLDPNAAWETGVHLDYVGVFRDGVLVAYGKVYYSGDIAGITRIMGHGDHLDDGVMFLLVAEIVARVKSARPETRFLFYDTFFGATAGLRWFKTHVGFQPYFVRWKRES